MSHWQDLGAAPVWVSVGGYALQDAVLGIDAGLDYVWVCQLAGLAAVTEPVWDAGMGAMDDGAVSWLLVAPWNDATPFAGGDLVQPTTPNGHWYRCLGTGVSGAAEPTWPTNGTNVDDGGTGSDDGSLILADNSDNDTGSGGSAGGVASHYIFQVWENPAIDRDAAPIGTLTEARDRRFRLVRNNCGDGQLTINVHSDEVDWLRQDRLVVVYRESLDSAPVFAWILEETAQVTTTTDEEGGETITWKGRGALALLERAVLWDFSVLPNGDDLGALPEDDRDGMWHWKFKSGAAILVRQLEEARGRGTRYGSGIQDSPMPNVYWTFARHTDSTGAGYDEEGPYKLPVGDNLFADVLPKLMQIGLLIRATPVINGDGHLRIRLDSWADDPGAESGIAFVKGTNILEAGEKVVEANTAGTDALVQGDLEEGTGPQPYVYVHRSDTDFRSQIGRKELFLPYQATPTTSMLARAGDILIRKGRKKHDGPTTLQVLERTGECALIDYTEWDYVTVTIPGAWSGYHDNLSEILLVENDIGVFEVGLQFADDDPVGVAGISIDNCACSQEPVAGDT